MRAVAVALAAVAAGCEKKETLKILDRVPLAAAVPENATITVDSLGRAWIGAEGGLVAVDTAGRGVARIAVSLPGTPRLLWMDSTRAVVRTGQASAVVDAATGQPAGVRRSEAPLARDPRGRWIYTATRTGSVLGLDARRFVPRWGWPDAGSPVSALAVSPYGDRVYVALTGSRRHDVPHSIEIRDAQSGRVLSTWTATDEVRALEVAPDGTLFALIGSDVLALRHGRDGLSPLWSAQFGGIGRTDADVLRVSPAGDRVAVLARGAELRVLAAADGKVLEESKQSPRDASWDAAGRLWVLGPREIRIVR